MGEDDLAEGDWDSLPKAWPDHLDTVMQALNQRILPSLQYTPKELLLGMCIDRLPVDHSTASSFPTEHKVVAHMVHAKQQQLEGYDSVIHHAIRHKNAFDKHVLKNAVGVVEFQLGDLVQVYRSDLDYTFKTKRKLLSKWSAPRQIAQ